MGKNTKFNRAIKKKNEAILGRYIFTLSVEDDTMGIQVEHPPVITTRDMSAIYSRCVDMYDEIKKNGFIIKPDGCI